MALKVLILTTVLLKTFGPTFPCFSKASEQDHTRLNALQEESNRFSSLLEDHSVDCLEKFAFNPTACLQQGAQSELREIRQTLFMLAHKLCRDICDFPVPLVKCDQLTDDREAEVRQSLGYPSSMLCLRAVFISRDRDSCQQLLKPFSRPAHRVG